MWWWRRSLRGLRSLIDCLKFSCLLRRDRGSMLSLSSLSSLSRLRSLIRCSLGSSRRLYSLRGLLDLLSLGGLVGCPSLCLHLRSMGRMLRFSLRLRLGCGSLRLHLRVRIHATCKGWVRSSALSALLVPCKLVVAAPWAHPITWLPNWRTSKHVTRRWWSNTAAQMWVGSATSPATLISCKLMIPTSWAAPVAWLCLRWARPVTTSCALGDCLLADLRIRIGSPTLPARCVPGPVEVAALRT
mmetsp:Transcript_96840/g.185946  ORF Transcript_96840/g.185946 Transcript_96840/m.185946 type:complete len:243 (-) Transcript_96840:404-1132(-)